MPNGSAGSHEPLVSYRAMFDAEVEQARGELRRPAGALFFSGVIAGIAVGVGAFLLALVVEQNGGMPHEPSSRLLFAGAYAIGFVIAILGRTDLFTEYTTIAIFPVLTGDAPLVRLARLWGLVIAGNLVGAAIIAVFASLLGPSLAVAGRESFAVLAEHVARPDAWTILASAILAGWMMGLLSWLIAGGRDTTSQILFVLLVGGTIGALGLHHAITGAAEMIAGALSGAEGGFVQAARVITLASLGNAIGGIVFAVMIRQGVQMHPGSSVKPDRGDREVQARQDGKGDESRR